MKVHERIAPFFREKPPIKNVTFESDSVSLANPPEWLISSLGGGGDSYAGKIVTQTSAMRTTAVYRAVALKSSVIASLGLKVYKATPSGRIEARDHWMWSLLHDEPNDLMSAYIWKEMIVANLMLAGNHYSIIEYDNAVRVRNILPIIPQTVTPRRKNGKNVYDFRLSNGSVQTLPQEDVIHIPGLGFDGLQGISPIEWAGRQSIGTAMAMEEYVGRMHANSARPSGVVSGERISEPAMLRLKSEFSDLYNGTNNVGRTIFLDKGMTWQQMSMSMADSQTLEHRRFSVSDIGRVFGVPPHLLGETDKQTSWGTGIEQMTIGFFIFNLAGELSRIEGELNRKLLTAPYYCEFNRDQLQAMDTKTLSEMYASAVTNMQMTPNEIRRRRNLPDYEGDAGNKLYMQSGMTPIDQPLAGAAP